MLKKLSPTIIWQIGPAEALPFEDNTFDRVVSQFGLMFFADQVKAIAEIESWIYSDIKGWTLADNIDDAGYERLKQAAPKKLSQFVLWDGLVTFEELAHICDGTNYRLDD